MDSKLQQDKSLGCLKGLNWAHTLKSCLGFGCKFRPNDASQDKFITASTVAAKAFLFR